MKVITFIQDIYLLIIHSRTYSIDQESAHWACQLSCGDP
jgi:hypothetical protein